MSKNTASTAAKTAPVNITPSPAPKATPAPNNGLSAVKAIKNKLFGDLKIGESVKIAGKVELAEMDEGTYGTFTRFEGEFSCKTPTGVLIAPKLYLPEVAESIVNRGYNAALEVFKGQHPELTVETTYTDEEAARKRKKFLNTFPGAEFALILQKVADTDTRNARGFQWVAKSMVEMAMPSNKYLALVSGE